MSAALLSACGAAGHGGATASASVSGAHASASAHPNADGSARSAASVGTARPPRIPSGNWPTFDFNAQRSGVGPADTGITAGDLGRLRRITVHLDGTVDASVIEIAHAMVEGRRQDVIVLTTSYGRTEALNAATGRRLWEFTPRSVARLQGTPQITTATPVLAPSGEAVYAASPDGYVHKLSLATGHQIWAAAITRFPSHEKSAGALNLDRGQVVAVMDGYDGDIPPYVGHAVLISERTGRVTHVFNALCSQRTTIIAAPATCHHSDAGIWGRPGSVVEPGSGRILVATGNGDFNGHTDWGDSVLELSPALRLLHNWTPTDQYQLNVDDQDLGSTEPALLPARGSRHYVVQGGKSGILSLLNLSALDGTSGPAGPRTGGQVQQIDAPGPTDVFSQPAVWGSLVFVADGAGTAAYRYGADARLRLLWQNTTPGTSPIVAGGLLYVYDENGGALNVYDPSTGHRDISLGAGPGHWNSPTVIGGRIFLPVGDANAHQASGTLYIWQLPR
ncbi:PQQ-binding-like beta-propeller repeat protein [Conexibacter sp. DBS9H8]|uniref:outer membrane protein assembly factor BamB family protein n=1 Tax=Conexibacter sp. DBS9H8 TaxID=2937801 RepID=UPI00200D2C39|nr:PQQ-binding-like beta-propeller repeat protein [Conexibacter sp. DBS9H8]